MHINILLHAKKRNKRFFWALIQKIELIKLQIDYTDMF
jgi:hypothetical protein